MTKIKVCFCLSFASNWLGGVNYFENLLSAIYLYESERICPIVILPQDASDSIKSTFSRFKVYYSPFLSRRLRYRLIHKLFLFIFGKNPFLENFIVAKGVDVLSHMNPVGHKTSIPFLPWIPDFQHLHLPHLFTSRDIRVRDKNMINWINHSPLVLLSSYSAASDMCAWSPSNSHKARVLQFVSAKILKTVEPSPSQILSLYGINKPYFFVPNQYWRHKNHSVLVKALATSLASANECLVVSTGSTKDHRDPKYFSEFLKLLDKQKVTDSYRILGEVPYSHLSTLMRESLAVINPSLFEGWSTTVEEAKSLDKQIILSNIPVHLEQSPSRALFFDPHDHLTLSHHMASLLKSSPSDNESFSLPGQFSRFDKSYADFATNYVDIVSECHHLHQFHDSN